MRCASRLDTGLGIPEKGAGVLRGIPPIQWQKAKKRASGGKRVNPVRTELNGLQFQKSALNSWSSWQRPLALSLLHGLLSKWFVLLQAKRLSSMWRCCGLKRVVLHRSFRSLYPLMHFYWVSGTISTGAASVRLRFLLNSARRSNVNLTRTEREVGYRKMVTTPMTTTHRRVMKVMFRKSSISMMTHPPRTPRKQVLYGVGEGE